MTRIELHNKLKELLDSNSVYYQTPGNQTMTYPAIVYSKSRIQSKFANNAAYSKHVCYDITVMDKAPDNSVIDEILKLPMSSFDRHYKADNLNHDVIKIYL